MSPTLELQPAQGRACRLPSSRVVPGPGGRVFRGPPWGSKGELVKTDMTETLLGSLALLLHKGVHAAWLCQLGGAACLSLPACFSPSCLLTLGPSSRGLLAWNRLPQRDASRAHLLLGSGLRRRPPGAPLCPGADVPRNCLLCSLGIALPLQMGTRSQRQGQACDCPATWADTSSLCLFPPPSHLLRPEDGKVGPSCASEGLGTPPRGSVPRSPPSPGGQWAASRAGTVLGGCGGSSRAGGGAQAHGPREKSRRGLGDGRVARGSEPTGLCDPEGVHGRGEPTPHPLPQRLWNLAGLENFVPCLPKFEICLCLAGAAAPPPTSQAPSL